MKIRRRNLRVEPLEDRRMLTCDFNLDSACDQDDLDIMYSATTVEPYDFDGNGAVDGADLLGWLAAASSSSDNPANSDNTVFMIGDLDLSGTVESNDLGYLLNNFGANAASAANGVGYGGGDVDMSGTVDSIDLARLLNNFGFVHVSKEPIERATDAVNDFGVDLYELLQKEEGNIAFSPLSIATAFAMAHAGAEGQTAQEMKDVFHFGNEPGIDDAFSDLLKSFDRPRKFQAEIANAIWPRIDFPVTDEYADLVAEKYRGTAQSLDYGNDPAGAEEIINDWIANKTDGKITDLVKNLSSSTVLVLTNALYFNSQWEEPFDPENTADRSFTLDNGEVIQTPTMQNQFYQQSVLGGNEGVPYTVIDGYEVFELPFKDGDTSMVIMLPAAGDTSDLSSETLTDIHTWLDSEQTFECMMLTLPKFETNVTTNLKPPLIEMGMPKSFAPGAEFAGIFGNDGPWIGKTSHQTFLNVNEQGTKAAAATQVEFVLCFAKGTPVLTPDGAKSIEEIKVGDYVLSKSETDVEGCIKPKLVEELFHGNKEILDLSVAGQTLRPTDAHPFFVKGRGWTPAGELQAGDLLSTNKGTWLAVESVAASGQTLPVYNFRVADYHTYFVGDEENGIWTHNAYMDVNVNRPFHFMIRDTTNDATMFMGRIDDPSMLKNEIGTTEDPQAAVAEQPLEDSTADEIGRDIFATPNLATRVLPAPAKQLALQAVGPRVVTRFDASPTPLERSYSFDDSFLRSRTIDVRAAESVDPEGDEFKDELELALSPKIYVAW